MGLNDPHPPGERRRRRRRAVGLLAAVCVVASAGCKNQPNAGSTRSTTTPPTTTRPATTGAPGPVGGTNDWTRFGYTGARGNSSAAPTGITAANVGRLRRQSVALPGTVDSSPIYLSGVRIKGQRRDAFFMTTSYGRTLAVDADSGEILWTFTPRGFAGWEGTSQITNSSPVAGSDRAHVFAVSPDGRLHKLAVRDGKEVDAGSWPARVSRAPNTEKIGPALNLARGLVLAATGGYFGDAPPYQGHVIAVDSGSGRVVNVWNSLCSDRHELLLPSSCPESGSAIWARAGVVVEPRTGNLLIATGNGEWDGHTHWGDSVLELSPDAGRLLQNYTPTDEQQLDDSDVDLGSSAPVVLPTPGRAPRYALEAGKDGLLRLLDLHRLNGHGGAGRWKGGELEKRAIPGGGVFTAPAVMIRGAKTWVFVATFGGTGAYLFDPDTRPRLRPLWSNETPGTSPVVAGGLVYVYDANNGRLNVYVPTRKEPVASLPARPGHWNSPVIADARIALPEGDANDHESKGLLDIYTLP